MSTIEEVRAERNLGELVDEGELSAKDPDNLSLQLLNAGDAYAKAVRELRSGRPISA